MNKICNPIQWNNIKSFLNLGKNLSSTAIKRLELLKSIISILTTIAKEVEINNNLQYYDINISCEEFYKGFLNVIYEINLKNLNLTKVNTSSIDLGDEIEKIAIQVTSDVTAKKAKDTLKLFKKNELNKTYSRLRMLYLKQKPDSKIKFETGDGLIFERIDYLDLIKYVRALEKTEHIERIHEYLHNETINTKREVEATEVQTIIDLITEICSMESSRNDKQTPPDPEGKIDLRFKDHSAFLKKIYADLYANYNDSRRIAEDKLNLDSLKISNIRVFLQTKSDLELRECNNDPQKALEQLVIFFNNVLSKHNKNYSLGAIRFYLINQLILCNVFPNEMVENK